MNRNRMIIGLVIAVALGLVVAIIVARMAQRRVVLQPIATQKIVVAAAPLNLGTRLRAEQLQLLPWPAGQPMQGMFTRIEDCVGRALTSPVLENEAILENKLAPKEAGAGLAATIPEGMRALSVRVNEVIGVAGFVIPSTSVDVLVTGSAGGQANSVTRTVLENIRVLAAGQKIEQDKDGKPQSVPVITLLVTPEDANKLTMASTEGKIQLALRNTIDTKKVDPPAVYEASLFGGMPAAKPSARRRIAPPPPPAFVVEMIVGTKRESKSFPNP